jgi:hypothetical protein
MREFSKRRIAHARHGREQHAISQTDATYSDAHKLGTRGRWCIFKQTYSDAAVRQEAIFLPATKPAVRGATP